MLLSEIGQLFDFLLILNNLECVSCRRLPLCWLLYALHVQIGSNWGQVRRSGINLEIIHLEILGLFVLRLLSQVLELFGQIRRSHREAWVLGRGLLTVKLFDVRCGRSGWLSYLVFVLWTLLAVRGHALDGPRLIASLVSQRFDFV